METLAETVIAAKAGDRDAFDDLVRATYDDTYTLALRLTGNSADAEDVAQDTYLRAFKGLARFRGDAHVMSWLYRITSNCAYSVMARRRRNGHELLELDEPIAETHPHNDPAARVDISDLRDRVVEALAQLPVKLRSVIVLRDIYDLSHEAIARQLGITESAAKVRLHRAREKLKVTLRRERTELGGSDDPGDSDVGPIGPTMPIGCSSCGDECQPTLSDVA